MNDLFQGYGIRVKIKPDNFLKIVETLTRLGVASNLNKTLYQSCHILHKQGHYAIMHFKEMFALDGKVATLSDEDIARRNKIAALLEEWGLLEIAGEKGRIAPSSAVKVLSYKEKDQWILREKYKVGRKSE